MRNCFSLLSFAASLLSTIERHRNNSWRATEPRDTTDDKLRKAIVFNFDWWIRLRPWSVLWHRTNMRKIWIEKDWMNRLRIVAVAEITIRQRILHIFSTVSPLLFPVNIFLAFLWESRFYSCSLFPFIVCAVRPVCLPCNDTIESTKCKQQCTSLNSAQQMRQIKEM